MDILHKLFEINDLEYCKIMSENKYEIDDDDDDEDIEEILILRKKFVIKINKINNRQFRLNNKRYYINNYKINK